MGECEPLVSSSSTIRPSKTSFITFLFCFICIFLAVFLLVWELLLPTDNEDHISTMTNADALPQWEVFIPASQ